MGRLGMGEILVLLVVVLVLFGGKKLPELGSSLGQAIRNFKRGFNGDDSDGEARKEQAMMTSGRPAQSAESDRAPATNKAQG